ncbi:von Willebrand factor D and EGF domain-containing protein-like isoform X2 [Antedon mediterranea]|uniref:von Willebrand factor D and EGF domain-containing protein-like isoform X2 n=1 Tax=Antedon mediterranea TaxID=105859 RepID=UPI003AF83902
MKRTRGIEGACYECSITGHRVIDEPFRSTTYKVNVHSNRAKINCDHELPIGWYKFNINGKLAEMPTKCVQRSYCGTSSPIWLETNGEELPLPGENRTFTGCVSSGARHHNPKLFKPDCCWISLTEPITVRNCGEFFVYFLNPPTSCSLSYCAQEATVRCKPSEYSVDGSCKEKYPAIVNTPDLSVAIKEDGAYLSSSYEPSTSTGNIVYLVTWYKKENEILTELFNSETSKTIAFLPTKPYIRMGDEVLCKVSTFFNITREWKSPAVESTIFKAEIRISSKHVEIVEDAKIHKLIFETTVPVVCETEGPCSVKIPLSVDKDENNFHPDIAISECFVEIKARKCSKRNCGKGVVYIKAVTDFMSDGDRISNIRTGAITSDDQIWNGYKIDDVTVFVKDVAGAQCYSFTDPHFITFDRLKYDFYKTGTYILHKSLNRDFEVNSRIWNCGGATDEISCNCGFVARENNDVISVDMCNGALLETKPEVKIKSQLPLADGVKIKESKFRKKITVSFPSGSFVRADISEWGMSISVQVPSSDFNHTRGLCGAYDGDPNNDYHFTEKTKMDIEMEHGQANEFVEQWRLRDGGLFNHLPEYKEYPKTKRFCNCEGTPRSAVAVTRKCTRYDDVIRTELIKSTDMTSKYKTRKNRNKNNPKKRDVEQFEYFFYPDAHDSDLQPVTPSWPTPTGVTELQAVEMCEKKLMRPILSYLCSNVLGSEMYIKDAIEMCVADLQLTDDFRWDSYAYTLIENECERALLENQTIWVKTDGRSVNNMYLLHKNLNCPYSCSGHGACTSLGCYCDEGFYSVDCSLRKDTPAITRIGDNGLCDKRTGTCDVIKVNVVNVKKSYSIRCHMTLLNTNEEITEFDSIGQFRNKQTILCPVPNKIFKGVNEPIKWAVQVSLNGGSVSNAVIFTVFDSMCFQCDWQGTCNMTIESFCFIEQTCRYIGETSPTNECLTCIPDLNIYEWSNKEDNLLPVFPVSHPLFLFAENTFEYQLEATDPDGDVLVYDLIWKEDDYGISLSEDGKLLWQPLKANHVVIPVRATDRCGANEAATIDVTVIECLCQNGGKCKEDKAYKETDVVCICPDDFKGDHCESIPPYDLSGDVCTPNPCHHGSCSVSIDAIFFCRCDAGYTGILCEQSVIPCDPNPCFDRVVCSETITDGSLSFRCGPCPPGYSGDGVSCVEVNRCSVTCPKNMRCTGGIKCICKEGWTGYGCRIALCRPDCQNGVCVAPGECSCYEGYTGKFCDKAICEPDCKHGGVCYAPNVCACPSGYVGPRCETMTCRLNCQNGGYCSDPDTCVCPAGYSGPTCEQALCQPDCMNGGVCANPSQCLCSRGYHGRYCETGVCDETCLNGGRCVRKNTCSCPHGFIGRRCEIPLCEPRCLNGGRCVAPDVCSCASGWRGRHCQKAVCSNGCRNKGVCIKPDVCACPQGYSGTSCQKPICERPCLYGGRCVEPNKCACRHGRTGAYCESRSTRQSYRRQYR